MNREQRGPSFLPAFLFGVSVLILLNSVSHCPMTAQEAIPLPPACMVTFFQTSFGESTGILGSVTKTNDTRGHEMESENPMPVPSVPCHETGEQ